MRDVRLWLGVGVVILGLFAPLFTRMGLLQTATAAAAVLFSTIIFLLGRIIGTFPRLGFTGTPTAIMALKATLSALGVVALVLIGFWAYESLSLSRARPWVTAYGWPIEFFVAVAFWSLMGTGLLGFLINPSIALGSRHGLKAGWLFAPGPDAVAREFRREAAAAR